jgi:tyrosyl-tRNA synthetase
MDQHNPVKTLKSIGEEITTERELEILYGHVGKKPLCYDGFEPSGRMHIAQGLLKTIFVKKMLASNCNVLFWIADWFAQLNNKMGGDINKIHTVGEYLIEIWKACGMPLENVQFVWASEAINARPKEYWEIVMDICGRFTVTRLKKCTKILGRKNVQDEVEELVEKAKTLITNNARCCKEEECEENDIDEIDDIDQLRVKFRELQAKFNALHDTHTQTVKETAEAMNAYEEALILCQKSNTMPTSYLLYAAMQCADIYFLKADICQLGMDQKKVNMLAREYHDQLFCKKYTQKLVEYRPKPIIISHHMLMGLKEGQEKMSKSDPESAIFMDDTEADVNRKIKKSFCKPQSIEANPVLDYYKHIVFPYIEQEVLEANDTVNGDDESMPALTIDKGKWGGIKIYTNYDDFERDFANGELHPSDIKPKLQKELNRMIQPIRDHFKNNAEAKSLMEKVKKFKVTK